MDVPPDEVESFLQDFSAWAQAQPDIQAAALVGSYARHTATDESDVDPVILAQDPPRYLRQRAWLRRFGEIRRQQREACGRVTSLRVVYADGREVEYGITGVDWAAAPLDEGTRRVIEDGMRILFERQPLLSPHLPKR